MANSSLAAGVIIEKNDQILMVFEKGQWGLPKGKREHGESLAETAIREAREETGLHVTLKEAAFITEFKSANLKHGHYLQVFYSAEVVGGTIQIMDPDNEIEGITYINKRDIRKHLTFRPRLIPLEYWLKHRTLNHHFFNLDKEAYFV